MNGFDSGGNRLLPGLRTPKIVFQPLEKFVDGTLVGRVMLGCMRGRTFGAFLFVIHTPVWQRSF